MTNPACFRYRATQWLYSPMYNWEDCNPPTNCGGYGAGAEPFDFTYNLNNPTVAFNLYGQLSSGNNYVYVSTSGNATYSSPATTIPVNQIISTNLGNAILIGDVTFKGIWGNLSLEYEFSLTLPDVLGKMEASNKGGYAIPLSQMSGNIPILLQCYSPVSSYSSGITIGLIQRSRLENPLNQVELG